MLPTWSTLGYLGLVSFRLNDDEDEKDVQPIKILPMLRTGCRPSRLLRDSSALAVRLQGLPSYWLTHYRSYDHPIAVA
jgi:hypothetical protein